jgi:hypothetical protein
MGIAEDLASVFDEIGTEVELVGSSPLVRESIDFAETDKVGIFAVTLRAGSAIPIGSQIRITSTNEHYFIYGGFNEIFENTPVIVSGRMFKATHRVKLMRRTIEKDPVTRQEVDTWTEVDEFWAYVTVPITGNGLNVDADEVFFINSVLRVVCRPSEKIEYLDRIQFPNVFFQVGTVDYVKYDGLCALELVEDTR